MKKVLLWIVANDGRFFQGAINILEQQYNGIEVVGMTSSLPIELKNPQGENLRRVSHKEVANDSFGGGTTSYLS